MEIDPALRQAVRERIDQGYERVQVLQELREAGYENAEAEAIYSAVGNERTVFRSNESASTSQQVTHSSSRSADTANGHSFFSQHPIITVVGIAVLVLLGGAVAASAWFDISGWRSYVPFLTSAPYDEGTLLPGIMNDLAELTSTEVDNQFRVAWEPRTADAKEALPEMFSAIESLGAFIGGLPDNAHMEAQVLSQIDARNQDDIRTHVEAAVDVEFDIMQIDLAGSLRQVDTTLYGRIDEFPATMQSELGDIPADTWIELFDESTLQELESGNPLPSIPGITRAPFLNQASVSHGNQPAWLTQVRELFRAVTPTTQVAQVTPADIAPELPANLEQGGLPTEPFAELDAETREAIRDAVARAWTAAPVVSFAEPPEQVRLDGEVVYEYNLNIDAENLDRFLATLRQELAEYPQLIQDLPARAEMPDAAAIAQVNNLVDFLVTVRPDGSLHGLSVSSTVTSPDQSFASQIDVSLSARYKPLGDDVNITVPEEVHSQTLLEMIEAEQQEAQEAMLRQQASSLRSTAEIYYNDNDFSYAGFCAEVRDRATVWSVEPQCTAASNAYAVQLPLTQTDAFCIDSTGFAGDVPAANWSTTTPSYTCSNE
jgi:hypothetical protein